jgi:glycosyltransferase involved in cell wall biosynthesis
MSGTRICFHVPYLYPLAGATRMRYTGGLEVQQWLLTRGLAQRGFDVHVVTCDFGQPAVVTHEGVTFHRSYPPHRGVPGVRFFHPRLSGSLRALNAAAADIYVMKGSGLLAGITGEVAGMRGARFVFICSHDDDTRRARPDLRPWEYGWYVRALRNASQRIAQTAWQQENFAREFGVTSEVVRNAVAPVATPADPGQPGTVLWLATYKAGKRPEWFTDLARAFPDQRFVMCGVIPEPPLTREVYERALAAAAASPNLEVHGFVEHDRLREVFLDASLVVHTSPAEGFPNVFLEAWSHGIPTVTTVDPDGVIARHGLGAVAADPESLREAVRSLMADPERRREMGQRAREYVAREHGLDRILDRYAELFGSLSS